MSLNVLDADNTGGRDEAGLKASGGKRSLVLLVCDGAVENYENIKKLFALLDLPSLDVPFRFTTDIKMLRIMLGLSGGNPKFGCPYCLGCQIPPGKKGEYVKGLNRTLGFCKFSHEKYTAAGSVKSDANKFYNCIETPIDIMSGEDDTWTLALYPPPVLHCVLLGGPNDLLIELKNKYPRLYAGFLDRFGLQMSEGLGGRFNGVSIRFILSTDRVLEDLKGWIPDKTIGEAVVDYFKATWNVYLVCMKQEIDDEHPKVFKAFKEKFLRVKKLTGVSHTVKVHIACEHMSEYMVNCQSTFSWTSDEFIESLHNKLRRFEENHSLAIKKRRKFGSLLHQQRLLSSIGLFNYENLGRCFFYLDLLSLFIILHRICYIQKLVSTLPQYQYHHQH